MLLYHFLLDVYFDVEDFLVICIGPTYYISLLNGTIVETLILCLRFSFPQPIMPPYGTPPHPYVAMYPHGGIYAHPSIHPVLMVYLTLSPFTYYGFDYLYLDVTQLCILGFISL